MKRLFLIAMLLPSQLGAGTLEHKEIIEATRIAISAAYWKGVQDGRIDAVNDLGHVRLDLDEVEELLR